MYVLNFNKLDLIPHMWYNVKNFIWKYFMSRRKKANYLNNKDILEEIRLSKHSYCEFTEENRGVCDFIVDLPRAEVKGKKARCIDPRMIMEYNDNLEARRADCLSMENINTAKENRAKRLSNMAYEDAMANYEIEFSQYENALVAYENALSLRNKEADSETEVPSKPVSPIKPTKKMFYIAPSSISTNDLVFRFHTFEHIPLLSDEEMKTSPITEADYRKKVNFVPFLHYKLVGEKELELELVGKSHYKNGEFDASCGAITPTLANMFILLTEKIAQKHNWRGYTYVDDMVGSALLHLSSVGLQFNEARSDNPFAYLTSTVNRVFLRVLQGEKREQDIRDDLIESAGHSPSNTRQMEHDELIRAEREKLYGDKK